MAKHKTWLEAALNGPWGRDRQANIPMTVNEIISEGIACAQAGAAVIHVHAYDEITGRQNDDTDTYAAIIEGIRAHVDVIVYPTLPLLGGRDAAAAMTAQQRFHAVEILAQRGLLEWTVIDPGSVNFTALNDNTKDSAGFTYENPESHIRYGLELAAKFNFHPGYAIYEPGFLRAGHILQQQAKAPAPVYRFMFSQGFAFGFAPDEYALKAYLNLLDKTAPAAQWMIAGLAVDIDDLIPLAVSQGGHVRTGLEDAFFGEQRTNLQLVERAVKSITAAGGELATAADIRQSL